MNTWFYEYNHKSSNDIMVLLYKQDFGVITPMNGSLPYKTSLIDGLVIKPPALLYITKHGRTRKLVNLKSKQKTCSEQVDLLLINLCSSIKWFTHSKIKYSYLRIQ